jgi:hypothetical protein
MADATPRPRPVASVPARARRPRTRPPRPLLPHARAHAENVWSSATPYGSTQCPAVRRPSSVLERPKTPPSVHRSPVGSRIDYKRAFPPCLALWHRRPTSSRSADRRPCHSPAGWSSRRADATLSSLDPPLDPTGARTTARMVAPAESSPEPSSKRPPPGRAVEPRRRPTPNPNRLQEPAPSNPQAASRPRPADPRRRLAGISPEPRRPAPEGHIAKLQLFLRDNPQSKGTYVRI